MPMMSDKDRQPEARKALIIKLFAAGDVLMATPVAEALAENGYHVSWLVGEWSAELLRENPYVHRTFVYPDKTFYGASLLSKLSIAQKLRREKFDVAAALHDHRLVKMFAKGIGARKTIFLKRGNGGVLHQGKAYFHALSSLGISGEMPSPKLCFAEEEQAEALTFFKKYRIPPDSRIIGLAPGGGMNPKTTFALKQWGAEKYSELAGLLIHRFGGRIFLFGHKDERALCEDIRQTNAERIVNTAGNLTLRETAACIKFCHVFIGSDSAPAHIASALSVPSVVLFGPTNPDVWKPFGAPAQIVKENYDCMPCYKDDGKFPSCPHEHRCMKTLSSRAVLNACEKLLPALAQTTA